VLVKSANRLADQLRLEQDGYHAMVFNPLGWERSGLVCLPALPPAPCGHLLYWRQPPAGENKPAMLVNGTAIGRDHISLPAGFFDQPFDLVEVSNGQTVPYQVVRVDDPLAASPLAASRYALGHVDPASVSVLNYNQTQMYDIYFQAEDVPSSGYQTYRFIPAAQPTHFESSLKVTSHSLENRYYKISLDEQSGAIVSIFDKELGQELVDTAAVHGFNQLVVRSPRTGETVGTSKSHSVPGVSGPLFASLVIKSSGPGCPQVTQEIVLYDSVKRIDFNNRILRDTTPLLEVYFAFPFAIPQPHFRYEASRAVIEPILDQLPGTNTDAYAVQHWVSVSNPEKAVTWCSREAPVAALGELWPVPVSQAHHGVTPQGYAHEFLRSPADYHHGYIYSYAAINNFRTNFSPVQTADVLYRYSLTSRVPEGTCHKDWRFGWEASTPLEPVLIQGPQPGLLPVEASFCQVEPANILLLAVKQAESGDGLVLRLAEMEGQAAHGSITLPLVEVKRAYWTNLVEEDPQPLACEPHRVTLDIPANGLATLWLDVSARV
jgi:alpha-mannosidase